MEIFHDVSGGYKSTMIQQNSKLWNSQHYGLVSRGKLFRLTCKMKSLYFKPHLTNVDKESQNSLKLLKQNNENTFLYLLPPPFLSFYHFSLADKAADNSLGLRSSNCRDNRENLFDCTHFQL